MMLRWIAFGIIAWLLVIAIFVSLRAKPLNATAIVCNPVLVPDVKAQRAKRISRT